MFAVVLIIAVTVLGDFCVIRLWGPHRMSLVGGTLVVSVLIAAAVAGKVWRGEVWKTEGASAAIPGAEGAESP